MIKLGLFLLVAPVVALISLFLIERNAVDSCLDKGGSYNYLERLCDLQDSHQFIPLIERFPTEINLAMLVSVIGLLLCMKGLFIRPGNPDHD